MGCEGGRFGWGVREGGVGGCGGGRCGWGVREGVGRV